MKINANFDQRVVVHSADMDWVDSPMPGVTRKPLDRVGDEVARATSIVRYAPGSHFSPHVHTGGEEFLVLEGVFQDEHGDYSAGSYIRNPPQSSHTPRSDVGCVIFVKLWQFDLDDRVHVSLDSTTIERSFDKSEYSTLTTETIDLYSDAYEQVSIQYWPADRELSLDLPRGAEVLVLEGEFYSDDDHLQRGSWLRQPCESQLMVKVGKGGAKVWLKQGHLNLVEQQIARLPLSPN